VRWDVVAFSPIVKIGAIRRLIATCELQFCSRASWLTTRLLAQLCRRVKIAVTSNPDIRDPSCGNAEQAATSAASDVLDVQSLMNRCMGNIDLVRRVLGKFQQRLPAELAELEGAWKLDDLEQVARVAHRVRGSSATVSAEGLARAASAIEEAGRGGRAAKIPEYIEQFRHECQRLAELPSDVFAGGRQG
jgi:HPt (histidine-containing phosphotransfer) domain-containing protein